MVLDWIQGLSVNELMMNGESFCAFVKMQVSASSLPSASSAGVYTHLPSSPPGTALFKSKPTPALHITVLTVWAQRDYQCMDQRQEDVWTCCLFSAVVA